MLMRQRKAQIANPEPAAEKAGPTQVLAPSKHSASPAAHPPRAHVPKAEHERRPVSARRSATETKAGAAELGPGGTEWKRRGSRDGRQAGISRQSLAAVRALPGASALG